MMKMRSRKAKTWLAVGIVASLGTQALAVDRDTIGTIIGGVIGGVIGSNVGQSRGAAIAGAVIGAVIGHEVGESLDKEERQAAHRAYLDSLNGPIDRPVRWDARDHGGRSGNSGNFQATREFSDGRGYICRSYVSETYYGRQVYRKEGTSCRYPDGSWQVFESQAVSNQGRGYDRGRHYQPVYNPPRCNVVPGSFYRGTRWRFLIQIDGRTVEASDYYEVAVGRVNDMRRSGLCY